MEELTDAEVDKLILSVRWRLVPGSFIAEQAGRSPSRTRGRTIRVPTYRRRGTALGGVHRLFLRSAGPEEYRRRMCFKGRIERARGPIESVEN